LVKKVVIKLNIGDMDL